MRVTILPVFHTGLCLRRCNETKRKPLKHAPDTRVRGRDPSVQEGPEGPEVGP
jgi:hypothetical protein